MLTSTLDTNVSREACPLNLAPTSSTTTMLVLCDALAMVLLEARGFQQEDFAELHPGGSLGRVLLTKVSDLMRTGDALALISPDTTISSALQAMTKARAGAERLSLTPLANSPACSRTETSSALSKRTPLSATHPFAIT